MPKFQYEDLKDILRCPNTLSPLVHEGDSLVCTDPACRLQYSILDGIPNMLMDDALELDMESWQAVMSRQNAIPSGDASSDQQTED